MEGDTTRTSGGSGNKRIDPATLMILRALAGERGKVDIGGRQYEFSGVTSFRLEDCQSGRSIVCGDTVSLLRTILGLLRDARDRQFRRHFSGEPVN
jgi:hypothetical protein